LAFATARSGGVSEGDSIGYDSFVGLCAHLMMGDDDDDDDDAQSSDDSDSDSDSDYVMVDAEDFSVSADISAADDISADNQFPKNEMQR